MRKRSRILSTVLAVMMMAMLIPASAVFARSTLDTALFDLQSLGIMTGDENGEMNLEDPVTRAEFTAITVRLMNMETAAAFAPGVDFKDVPDDYWAKAYINYLSSLNIINGTGNGLFEPEGQVTLEMASKILINVLGYYMPAEDAGGYPTGYLSQAQKIGLLDSVDRTQVPLTRTEVVMMAYNALDINMVVEKAGTNGQKEYVIVEGETLRNRIRTSDGGELAKFNGIVTANIDTYLESPIANMETNQIEINGKLYQVVDPSAKQYLGQSVDFFLHNDQSTGKEVITSITPTDKNRIYDIPVKDIKTVTNDTLEYFLDDTGKTSSRVRFNDETLYVYNNQLQTIWSEQSLKELQRGNLKMIDNDQDGLIEVILVKEYNSAVVDEVRTESEMVYFKDGFELYGKKYFELSPDDPDLYITLVDTEGKNVGIDDLEQGDVLSAFENGPDDTRIEVIVSQNVVNDVIDEVREDEVTIGGETYGLERDDALGTFKPGDRISAYINFNHEIVYVQKETAKEGYGFVIGVAEVGNLGGQTVVRMLIPDAMAETFDEKENEDSGEAEKIAKLAAKNKEIISLDVAPKLNIEGAKVTKAEEISEKLLYKVVSFTTNSDGELNRITFPVEVGQAASSNGNVNVGEDKTYNSYERTFGKTASGAFGVNETTLTLCIPKSAAQDESAEGSESNEYTLDPTLYTDDDFLVNVEMENGRGYTVKAFDKNHVTYTADLIVVQSVMKAGSGSKPTSKSKVGFVVNTSVALNDNGDEVQVVEMMTENTTKSVMVSETLKDSSSFRNIKQGELISYTLDGNEDLDGYVSLSNGEALSDSTPIGLLDSYTENETFFGYQVDASYNQVSDTLNRWVHVLEAGEEPDGSSVRQYEVTKFNGPPVFLYNVRNRTADFADVKEIRTGSDKIFISTANSTVRAIVIVR